MTVPLRLRLTLIGAAAMAVVLLLLGAFFYTRLAADLLDSVDMGLRSRAQVLLDATDGGRIPSALLGEGSLIDTDEAFAQILDRAGEIVQTTPGVEEVPLLAPAAVASVVGPTFVTARYPGFDDPVRLMAVPAASSADAPVVVVGATLGDINDALGRVLTLLVTLGPIVLVSAAVAGWLLAGAALRPVERMRREAEAVSASDLDRRLPVPRTGDELARLAATLNTMLDRLQEAMERDHRFVDDASHELRTPLAALRAEIDLALAKDRPPEALTAALVRAQEDVRRLQGLADDLLVLARTRDGRVPIRRVATDLPALLAHSVASVERQARSAGVKVEVGMETGSGELDPVRVEQALRNLLENAIRHTPRGGQVRLSATRTDGIVTFVVGDDGPGFAPQVLETAFDPFVRADRGSDDVGDGEGDGSAGAGLGLTIVRAVANAHGGDAVAENFPDGARVTITIRA